MRTNSTDKVKRGRKRFDNNTAIRLNVSQQPFFSLLLLILTDS